MHKKACGRTLPTSRCVLLHLAERPMRVLADAADLPKVATDAPARLHHENSTGGTDRS